MTNALELATNNDRSLFQVATDGYDPLNDHLLTHCWGLGPLGQWSVGGRAYAQFISSLSSGAFLLAPCVT